MVERDGGKVEIHAAVHDPGPETVRPVREAAQREGKTMTAMATEAIEEEIDRDRKPTVNEERTQYVLGLGNRVREHMERVNPEWLERDSSADLYDEETGLPK